MKDLLGMIPGVGKMIRNVNIDEDAFKVLETMIYSMTEEERNNPKIINSSRVRRIASGSGTSIVEVNKLIKQFNQMGKMMKALKGGGLENMMKGFNPNQMPNNQMPKF